MKKKVLFASQGFPLAVQLLKETLGNHFQVAIPDSDKELYEQVQDVNVIIPAMEKIDRRVMDAAPELEMVVQFGVGLEGVDGESAEERGIPVYNVPGENADSVAECSLYLMFSLARRAKQSMESFRHKTIGTPVGSELRGKKLCIVGLGSSGSKLARLASCIGMKCSAVRKHPEKGAGSYVEELVGPERLDYLLPAADYVSLHVPLTEETRGMFNRDRFNVMKRSSCVVNVSRGPVIVKEDLYDALVSGEIAGAGLDVFWTEPPDPDDPIYSLPNVVTTPHIAGVTVEAYQRIARKLAEMVREKMRGHMQ